MKEKRGRRAGRSKRPDAGRKGKKWKEERRAEQEIGGEGRRTAEEQEVTVRKEGVAALGIARRLRPTSKTPVTHLDLTSLFVPPQSN